MPIHHRKQRPTNGVGRDGPVIEIGTLDQQVRTGIPPNQIHLSPQPTLDECEMEVSYGLTLDDRPGSDEIVPGREGFRGDRSSERLKQLADPCTLMHVDNHPDRLIYHQPLSLRRQTDPICANSFHEVERK